jgi:hypothetical protein
MAGPAGAGEPGGPNVIFSNHDNNLRYKLLWPNPNTISRKVMQVTNR